jgi:hypothetical protein
LKIFVGYGYNKRDMWIEAFVLELIRAFGADPITGKEDGKTAIVTANDLLARTVFYKVGHHSSHNATAKSKGLEMMTSQSQLTAFIPVDRQVALGRSPAGTWKMPARQLYRALLDKCQGRVVRSDVGWAANVKLGTRGTESEFAGLGTDAEWTSWTKSQQSASVQIEANHIDFVLE